MTNSYLSIEICLNFSQQTEFVRYVVRVNLAGIKYAGWKILNINRVGIILGRQNESAVPLIPYAILAPNLLLDQFRRLELIRYFEGKLRREIRKGSRFSFFKKFKN